MHLNNENFLYIEAKYIKYVKYKTVYTYPRVNLCKTELSRHSAVIHIQNKLINKLYSLCKNLKSVKLFADGEL